jgi:hypothetical protein
MMRFILALVGVTCVCAASFADELDLSFNSDALRVVYVHNLKSSPLNVDGGWLYNSDTGQVVHIGMHLGDVASGGANPVQAGLGGRVVYTDGDLTNQKGIAVPVGGYVLYTPRRFNRFRIGAAIYYAPDVLSTGDMKKYEDYSVRFGYNVMREADIYIGARYVSSKYKNASTARYDTGMNIGMTLRF